MKNFENTLGSLSDPNKHNVPINLENKPTEWLLDRYRDMLAIRLVEETIAELYQAKETKTPIHLSVGQEAIAVGVFANLSHGDKIYSTHRSHSHYLATGAPIRGILAEILGRSTGVSGGMGGSMHLYAPTYGFHGSVPIVGGTIPIAVGAALASKMERNETVAVCFFGDGACEEGVLHESLNLARVFELPVLFVCENNLYSSHLDLHERQPSNSMARFAKSHLIENRVVDGNDINLVSNASAELISLCRNGKGPGFLEAVTFRWLGHVGPNKDVDVGLRRNAEELNLWKGRDPIQRLMVSLKYHRGVSQKQIDQIKFEIKSDIFDAIEFARSSPYPETSKILEHVYSEK